MTKNYYLQFTLYNERKNNVVVTWSEATELDLQLNIKVNEY